MKVASSVRQRLLTEIHNCQSIVEEERILAARADIEFRSQAHHRTAEYYAGMAAGIEWTLWSIDITGEEE